MFIPQNPPAWHRSSYCETGTCLEAARIGDMIQIRDSKDPAGPVLTFTLSEWKAFLQGVRALEFDVD